MYPDRPITPSALNIKDLLWQIQWSKDKCALCGKCTAVCPVNAIELGTFRKRLVTTSLEPQGASGSAFEVYHGIRQLTALVVDVQSTADAATTNATRNRHVIPCIGIPSCFVV